MCRIRYSRDSRHLLSSIKEKVLHNLSDVNDRGRKLMDQYKPFSDEEFSSKFFHLNLECLMRWASMYQFDQLKPSNPSQFKVQYQRLQQQGVVFPDLKQSNKSFKESSLEYNGEAQKHDSGEDQKKLNKSEKSSHFFPDTTEETNNKKMIEEGLKAMRINQKNFISSISITKKTGIDQIELLFSESINLFKKYKPFFEPILKSNERKMSPL